MADFEHAIIGQFPKINLCAVKAVKTLGR
jgi:hypothetical protein